MEGSPFDKLAAELRELIYIEVLADAQPFTLSLHCAGEPTEKLIPKLRLVSAGGQPSQHHAVALTAACKQMRNETLPLCYTAFRCAYDTYAIPDRCHYFEALKLWLVTIGTDKHQHIRKLHLSLGTFIGYPPNRICTGLASIARMLSDSGDQTNCSWELTLTYEHWTNASGNRKISKELRLPLKATAVSEYTTAEYAEKNRALMRSYREGKIIVPQLQVAQADLHEHRRHVEPFLKELVATLKEVEDTTASQVEGLTEEMQALSTGANTGVMQ